jgi:hypothetical protein
MTQTNSPCAPIYMLATLPQRCFGSRLVCVLVAAPIVALAFLPILLQAARM